MKTALGNYLVAALAVACSMWAAWQGSAHQPSAPAPAGASGVTDASGHWVPAAEYQRIVALSTIACAVLPDLIARQRVVLISDWYRQTARQGFRWAGTDTIAESENLEAILASNPDLVIINNFTMRSRVVEQLRAAGIVVLDLGAIEGPPTLLPNIRLLGTVLQQQERGQRLAAQLERRLQQVASHIPQDQRLGAIYLERHGRGLSGGTRGSSYHHLLQYAGLIDVAATGDWSPWPRYRLPDVVAMDPAVIVTTQGMAEELRRLPGVEDLTLRIIELPRHFDSTGPEILEHAEYLCDAVYGPPP